LNVRHYNIETRGLKLWSRGHVLCDDLPAEFQDNKTTGSEVI